MTIRMEAAGRGPLQGMGRSWEPPPPGIFLSQDGDSQLWGQGAEQPLDIAIGFSPHGEAAGPRKATAAQG